MVGSTKDELALARDERTYHMTTLVDIYKAAGATVTDDGMIVGESMTSLNGFDIVLTVIPQSMTMERGYQPKIEFAVLLKQEVQVHGGMVEYIDHSFEIEMPVDQVRILKKEQ